jgi:DNA-binding NarL/FixJ family response regulator
MSSATIILVDDHKLVRQGVRSLIESQSCYEIVGEAGDGWEGLELIDTLSPDIAILDMMMPGLNGIEVAKLARQRGLRTRIIFLTMHANAAYAVRALQSGALGYVLKDSDFSEILCAIEYVLLSRRYLGSAIAGDVLETLLKMESGGGDSLDLLSPREREILQLVAEGNTSASIADRLTLSIRTVESHRFNTMKKLRLTSNAELVKFAINTGLITP